jgi:uncharacterized membrane protein
MRFIDNLLWQLAKLLMGLVLTAWAAVEWAATGFATSSRLNVGESDVKVAGGQCLAVLLLGIALVAHALWQLLIAKRR